MYELLLKNVRCFREARLRLAPGVTILIGDNGSGKTTLAESLASLCQGEDEGLKTFPGRTTAINGRIALVQQGQILAEWNQGQPRQRWNQPILAYGRYRRVWFPKTRDKLGDTEILSADWDERPDWRKSIREASQRRYTSTLWAPDSHLLMDIQGYLKNIYEESQMDPKHRVWKALQRSLKQIGPIKLHQGEIKRGRLSLPLAELSDGYQAVLVIVLDLLLRYHHWFADLPDPLQGERLVVIDEVDLHLHLRWQRQVVRQLHQLFPKTTFLLTTHSPAVVQGALDDHHPVYRLSDKQGASKIIKVSPKHLRGAELGTLMAEPFAIGSRGSVWLDDQYQQVEELRAQVKTDGRPETRQRLIKKLQTLAAMEADELEHHQGGELLKQMQQSQLVFLEALGQRLT